MRTIRFEEPFSTQISKLRIDFKRLDEALENLGEVLSKAPELFPQAAGTPLRRVRLTAFPGVPPLSIFFLCDETHVYLMSAELLSEPD